KRKKIGFGSPQHPYLQKYELEAQSTVRVRSGKWKRRHQLSFGLRALEGQTGYRFLRKERISFQTQ
ncbi:hypothetical protein M3I53_38090, partial [Paraburkholderia sp. CNPSo 3272]|uniref:hypothetical protein n=1 Tax=Paraburkholderia sp. CNPSo 3272 TaxID=2940931 RepID=UPI0020B6AE97